jgi:hypothetical protein
MGSSAATITPEPTNLIRLLDLEYYGGAVVDDMTDDLRESVALFQRDWDLTANGTLDAPTCAKMRELHDGAGN